LEPEVPSTSTFIGIAYRSKEMPRLSAALFAPFAAVVQGLEVSPPGDSFSLVDVVAKKYSQTCAWVLISDHSFARNEVLGSQEEHS
jgi:hypothetical protein